MTTQMDAVIKKECKGIVCQASVSNEFTSHLFNQTGIDTIIQTRKLEILHAKSCDGCKKCFKPWDKMGSISNSWPVKGMENIEDGKIYKLKMSPFYKDWNFYLEEVNAAD